jgi:hypothetical protein
MPSLQDYAVLSAAVYNDVRNQDNLIVGYLLPKDES